MKTTDIAVIGAGPAGLSCAVEAARAGAQVTVLDENLKPGGQLFKQIHKFFGSREHKAGIRGFRIGQQLLEETEKLGVEVLLDAAVYGIYEDRLIAYITDGKDHTIKAKKIVMATGASENALAFPGCHAWSNGCRCGPDYDKCKSGFTWPKILWWAPEMWASLFHIS